MQHKRSLQQQEGLEQKLFQAMLKIAITGNVQQVFGELFWEVRVVQGPQGQCCGVLWRGIQE